MGTRALAMAASSPIRPTAVTISDCEEFLWPTFCTLSLRDSRSHDCLRARADSDAAGPSIREGASCENYLKSPLLGPLLMLPLAGLVLIFCCPDPGNIVHQHTAGRIWSGAIRCAGLRQRRDSRKGQSITPQGKHRRGAVVSSARQDRSARRRRSASRSPAFPSRPEDETKHFKLIGTTGTGKSTAIREILTAALARGDRAIIADPDGGYLARFYDAERGDVILNPFDGDARKWDLFGEITNDYDVEQLARSLIPDSGDRSTWSEYARTFFTAVVQQLYRGGRCE